MSGGSGAEHGRTASRASRHNDVMLHAKRLRGLSCRPLPGLGGEVAQSRRDRTMEVVPWLQVRVRKGGRGSHCLRHEGRGQRQSGGRRGL